ncbi:MAG: phosphoribosyltransferase family protein [Acidimicrobiales bacterium]
MRFNDRIDAGRRLGAALQHLRSQSVVVLGLPRGGVPVAAEVARSLGAPLDVLLVRKLGVPFQPEVAMGAIAEGGVELVDRHLVRGLGISDDDVTATTERELHELRRRAVRYRGDRPPQPLAGRTVVVVDDGVATGSTARAACIAARMRGAAHVVLATPVAPLGWEERIDGDADECVAVETPSSFQSVGQFYVHFEQTSDEEVVACLAGGGPRPPHLVSGGGIEPARGRDAEIIVPIGPVRLGGHLTLPVRPRGVVLFAHGSGSSRHSPRNRLVAGILHEAGIGTLLMDLLTPEEERTRANVFDMGLLAGRLIDATRWIAADPDMETLPIGYFGASTGAGAALVAAAVLGEGVSAVVSRGGRPDLAGARLPEVTAPTLLIVGSEDTVVLDLNREAQEHLRCPSQLTVIAGATHLFEEPGTLRLAAESAREWFLEHLRTSQAADR